MEMDNFRGELIEMPATKIHWFYRYVRTVIQGIGTVMSRMEHTDNTSLNVI